MNIESDAFRKRLEEVFSENGFNLEPLQTSLFCRYHDFLKDENEHLNLTSILDDEEMIYKHFLDSVMALKYVDFGTSRVMDLGSGGGFPGVPLKIMRPGMNIVLCESIKKKAAFLERLSGVLWEDPSSRPVVAAVRGEDYLADNRIDMILVRAVGSLDKILSLLLKKSTKKFKKILFYKGPGYAAELKDLSPRVSKNISILDTYRYSLKDIQQERVFILFSSIST